MATRINFIDLYSFYNDMDSFIIETLLDDSSISFSIRTLGHLRHSADSSDFSEKRIAVEEGKVENARKIISEAIRAGVISKDGRFRA